jgi:hypothetical protein
MRIAVRVVAIRGGKAIWIHARHWGAIGGYWGRAREMMRIMLRREVWGVVGRIVGIHAGERRQRIGQPAGRKMRVRRTLRRMVGGGCGRRCGRTTATGVGVGRRVPCS